MLRSMYSGISGMKVNQVKLDVLGNNIANSSTTAFKSSRVRFQDMLSQNTISASSPSRNQGGVNPGQVGLGVRVSGIDSIVTQGMMQPTGRNLDVAVDGTGYFIVGTGPLPASNNQGVSLDPRDYTVRNSNGMSINYTRDGALALDYAGNLLTSDGYRVLGYAVNEQGGYNKDTLSIDYNKNGTCSFVDANSEFGLKAGNTLVPLKITDSIHMNASVVKGDYMTYTGSGDKSKIKQTKAADGTVTYSIPKITLSTEKYNGKNDLKVELKYELHPTAKAPAAPAEKWGWNIYINGENFNLDKDGLYTDKTTIDLKANGITTEDCTLTVTKPDFNGTPSNEEIAKYSWATDISAEGEKRVRTFMIEKSGLLKAVLEDGKVGVLGQVAMAAFKNPEGLERMGKNLYSNSANSGEAVVRSGVGATISNEEGFGDCAQGMLEMSNVDLAEQFTDMIVANRAFQASSKMISTGDEILQDIINLKR
ncbi:flagellar hook protein FlgE [Hathewaya massiliensis]|uniref:flagellar hook protein FlgE n=1 Tax=Hathewaya massiliensis TaxID=1964382 RepID=UPI00115BB26D|nr:flagellar hook-basal body complex protein [Hathewaya massiliensis]